MEKIIRDFVTNTYELPRFAG